MMGGENNDAINTFDDTDIMTGLGFWRTMFSLNAVKEEHCIPAIVEEDPDGDGFVKVRPLVKRTKKTMTGVEHYDRTQYRVRIYQICHGGFTVSIPIFKGDTGILLACDRDAKTATEKNASSLVEAQENYSEGSGNEGPQAADSYGCNRFMFGFFIPFSFANKSSGSEDGNLLTMSNNVASDGDKSGKCTVSLSRDGVLNVSRDGYELTLDGSGFFISYDGYELKLNGTGFECDAKNGDKILFGESGFLFKGEKDRTQTVITDLRYDLKSHQIQKKTMELGIRGTFVVEEGAESDWSLIEGGQAVSAE